ncbi:MAG: 50S ribosomal protein L9 [Thermodesulfobacteriota bacterium]
MKIILKETVPSLGKAGTVVEVARGFARNFLIPQGKALEATPGNLARVEQEGARRAKIELEEKEAALGLITRFEGLALTIPQRVGEEDRLYGSVTATMIAEALLAQGLEVERKQLELPEPIKKLGTYEVTVRLAPEVKTTIQVEVVPET